MVGGRRGGVRIFLIFIMGFLLVTASAYALMSSSSAEDSDTLSDEEAISSKIEEEIEEFKNREGDLMERSSQLREEREKNLRPFVNPPTEIKKDGTEALPVRYTVKGFIPASTSTLSKTRPSGQGFISKPIVNLIFFPTIIILFLSAYYFIRPK